MNETANSENRHPLKSLELRVLKRICKYKTSRQIAGNLNLSIKSIERFRSILFNKLDVDDWKSLVVYARKNRLFTDVYE